MEQAAPGKIESELNTYIEIWWNKLASQLEEIRNRDVRPVLVALSRKMPRFMEWFTTSGIVASSELSILDGVELTTELALPFIISNVSDGDLDKIEFIIIDDIIVHGTSLRTVSTDLYTTTRRKPRVACIFLHERATIPDTINMGDTATQKRFDQTTIDRYVNEIATIIEDYQLPIDMEFPIMSINDGAEQAWEQLEKEAEKLAAPYNSYIIEDQSLDNLIKRLTICDFGLPVRNIVPDFRKYRFFHMRGKPLEMEVFSPVVLSEYALTSLDVDLFSSERYKNIWNLTTNKIRAKIAQYSANGSAVERARTRISYIRSLCVWANYLLSFSCFINKKSDADFAPYHVLADMKLSQENLSLLLGREMTRNVLHELNGLLQDNEETGLMQSVNVKIPDSFTPERLRARMGMEKGMLQMKSKKHREILDGVVRYQHYSNEFFNKPFFAFDRLFFGETITSYEKLISPYFKEKEQLDDVNKWVDENIDGGYLVPKYERIAAASGEYVWRRYFHPGLRSKTLLQDEDQSDSADV